MWIGGIESMSLDEYEPNTCYDCDLCYVRDEDNAIWCEYYDKETKFADTCEHFFEDREY